MKALAMPMLQTVLRGFLYAAIGALGIEVRQGDLDATSGVLASLACAVVALVWSYANKHQLLHTKPPELPEDRGDA